MKKPIQNLPKIHILMACHNGEEYLQEQLQSIVDQTHKNWALWVSDDGSSDSTLKILHQFAKIQPQKVSIFEGPRKGATQNFFHLIKLICNFDALDLFAFCDQDDVWLPQKLSSAVATTYPKNFTTSSPFLYCSRTNFVDAQLNLVGVSAGLRKQVSFSNALVQNIASGNTMVFNAQLLNILKTIEPEHAAWHDWCAYLAVTAAGGRVHFDDAPTLLYRQHQNNVFGAKSSFMPKLHRLDAVRKGLYREWTDCNMNILLDIYETIEENNKSILQLLRQSRKDGNAWKRLRLARKAGLYRQSPTEHFLLFVCIFFNLL